MVEGKDKPDVSLSVEVEVGVHLRCHSLAWIAGCFFAVIFALASMFFCIEIAKFGEGVTISVSMFCMFLGMFAPIFFVTRRYPCHDTAVLTDDSIILNNYPIIKLDDVMSYELTRSLNLKLYPEVLHGNCIAFTGAVDPIGFEQFYARCFQLLSSWQYSPKVLATEQVTKHRDATPNKTPQLYILRGSRQGRWMGASFIVTGVFGIFAGLFTGQYQLIFMAIVAILFGISLL